MTFHSFQLQNIIDGWKTLPTDARCDKIKSLKFPGLWMMQKLEHYISDAKAQASVIHVYFKELGIIKYKKDELYGLKDMVGE